MVMVTRCVSSNQLGITTLRSKGGVDVVVAIIICCVFWSVLVDRPMTIYMLTPIGMGSFLLSIFVTTRLII